MNRAEYANAIRDLLSLEIDHSKYLPTDDSTRGFDNIAGALSLSPALLESYVSPFLRASQSGDVELMKLLLAHGADPGFRPPTNVTPLAVAEGIG